MKVFTYKMDHDIGFAPNPFFERCTLACCKPSIRNEASVGDYVVGMAGRGMGPVEGRAVFWMLVSEILTFNDYWNDPRFARKKPNVNGPKKLKVGDNTYRRCSRSQEWVQEHSMHYMPGMRVTGRPHIQRDTRIDKVLVSEDFTYWGANGPVITGAAIRMFRNRDRVAKHPQDEINALWTCLGGTAPRGRVAKPAEWTRSRYFVEA